MLGTTRRAMWQVAVQTAVLLSLVGCGGGFFPPLTTTTGGGSGSGTNTGNFVYVANATTSTVAGFSLATSTGGVASLTAISGSPVALAASPSALAITPANTFLFVAVTGAIYAYSINTSTGVLSLANGGAAAISSLGVVSIDISPDGQWLVALADDGATINEYQINASNGTLSAVTGAQYTTFGNVAALPKMIRFAPNAAYVAVALGTGGDLIMPFATSTGLFGTSYQQLTTGDTRTGDNAIVIDSASTFVYMARSGTTNGVAVYSLGANGVPTAVAGSPFAAGGGPFALQIDSTGKYLYAANRTDGTISGFTIGTGGVLAALGGSPYASGSGVTALARDNTAKYLLAAAGGGAPDLTLYSFDTTVPGKLVSATTTASGVDPAGSVAVAATH